MSSYEQRVYSVHCRQYNCVSCVRAHGTAVSAMIRDSTMLNGIPNCPCVLVRDSLVDIYTCTTLRL